MTLNRAHPLCRNLLFAAAPGESKGFTASTFFNDVENVSGARMVYNAAVLNASPWQGGNECGGQGLDNGDGSFVAAPEALSPSGTLRYKPTPTGGFSAAVLVRPDLLSTDATIPIFKCRNQPYGATDAGWHFSPKASNQWRFAYSDGVNERSAGTVNGQDPNLIRGDLLLVTIPPTMDSIAIYMNGTLEGNPSFTATNMGNVAGTPIKFLGLGTAGAGQPNYAGLVTVGYVWNRTLSLGEINMLTKDPFAPWRQQEEDYGALVDFISNDRRWRMKMPRPFPTRGRGLWRGVLFASAPWVNGFRQDDNGGDYDDITGKRAVWSPNPQVDGSAFATHETYGRAIQDGNPNVNSVPKWAQVPGTPYDVGVFGMSAAVLVKPSSLQSDNTIPIFRRRSSTYGPAQAGWSFTPNSGNVWKASISDGTTEIGCSSARPQSTVRADLLIMRYNGSLLELFVNGILEDASSGSITIGNPVASVNLLGTGGVGGAEFDGVVGLGVLWNRPITKGEIEALATDPFAMWRRLDDDVGLGTVFQTYFLSF